MKKRLMDKEEEDRMVRILRVISNPSRFKIVYMLNGHRKGMSVKTIKSKLKLEQSLISHHLIRLKDTGVLKSRREGRMVFYSLDKQGSLLNSMFTSGRYSSH